jgi:hypothetical protein
MGVELDAVEIEMGCEGASELGGELSGLSS